MIQIFGIDISTATIIVGALTGVAYGLLAVGLVIVYRATRIINFAHGEIGAFCALVMAILVADHGWAFLPAIGVALLLGLALGVFWELVVVRPLFDRPRLVLLISTIGIAQVMTAAQLLLPDVENNGTFPTAIHTTWHVGGTVLNGGHILLLLVAPVAVGLVALFWRSDTGLAVRAASENLDAARLAGIPIARLSTIVFALAGVLAALTFVLVNPVRGESISSLSVGLGPSLLLRALIAALVGRMWSISWAMIGGIGLGVFEAVILQNATSDPAIVDVFLFVVLLALVLFRGIRDTDTGTWTLAPPVAPIPRELLRQRRAWLVSIAPFAPLLLAAVAAPLVLTSASQQFTLAQMAIFGIAGLSVVLITGWGGQLSLAQFAFVGLGAFVLPRMIDQGMTFLPAMLVVAVVGAIAALVIGLPALRIGGIQLAVVTLGFAVLAGNWLFQSDILTGGETLVFVDRPKIGPLDLADQRVYYYVCLGLLLVLSAGLAHLKRSGFGRTMIAARDNPRSAEAMTIWPAAVKLSTFCLSGAIAAFAGGLLAGLLGSYTASAFLPGQSMTLLAMAVVGGIAYASGAALSAAAFIALPAIVGPTVNGWFGNNQGLLLLITGVGLIAILIQEPRGIAGRLALAREHFVRRQLARIRPGDEPELAPRSQDIVALAAEWADTAPGDERPLETHDVRVAFGGLIANAGVSIHADKGEIVGLIGNNGAGKTTLMNVISGFVKPVAGEVRLFGEDVTRMPPYQRAEFGVARVFQDARLFEGLTVRETIATALEFDQPSNMTGALLCLPGTLDAEFDKIERVEEVLAALNLEKYADSLTSTLSIGTRRVVEIACTIVASPRLILLDEPTAGIAQREAEAFGPIIRHLRDALGATIIIIEHDIPLLMSICDRVYAMGAGAVIAEGDPETVRSNPQVIAAYLGSDERSLQRSLHVTPATS